jgi:hypothetical protein
MNDDLQNRVGRFRLPQTWIRDHRFGDLLAALDGCIVVRAESLWHCDAIDYVALHADFEPVRPGHEAPQYMAIVSGGRRAWAREPAA